MSKKEIRCRLLSKKHKVIPGKSFGTLSIEQQSQWMRLRCDLFFCKPNKMEGRGRYHCEPRDNALNRPNPANVFAK